MASDFRGWETDPLFAAAEVVQDSADRMETLYRLVLHESSLIGGDHPDSDVVSSLKLHRRDLLTAIETTKWQLEDFEKAASSSITRSKLWTRDILVARYRQFVDAIREQVCQIEKNLDYSSFRDSIVDTSHVSLNTQDGDSLTFFLSGVMVNPVDRARLHGNDTKNSCVFKGFLDATEASCSVTSTNEIVEEKTLDTGNIIMKGAANFIQDSSNKNKSNCAEHGDWDLEARSSECEILQGSKFEELINGVSFFFSSFGSLSSLYGSRIKRNYTRKSKDEEQRHYPSLNIFQRTKTHHIHARKWSASALTRFQVLYSQLTTRITHSSNHRYACMRRPVQSIITLIVAALFLGIFMVILPLAPTSAVRSVISRFYKPLMPFLEVLWYCKFLECSLLTYIYGKTASNLNH